MPDTAPPPYFDAAHVATVEEITRRNAVWRGLSLRARICAEGVLIATATPDAWDAAMRQAETRDARDTNGVTA